MTTFSIFILKMQNEQGILFIHQKLAKTISFRHPFRLPVSDFGHSRVNRRCLWRPGTHLAAVLSHSLGMSASPIYLESVGQQVASS